MDEVARYALTASVVASAVGGIVLCAIILRSGPGPPEEDEYPLPAHRMLFIRTGQCVAAVCFAVTALLAVVALSRAPQSAAADASPEVRRLEHEVRALEARLGNVEEVLGRVGGAIDDLAARLDPSRPGSAGSPRRSAAPHSTGR
ncbi:MAG: hypothetical protein ACREM3_09195 [Candidatus Rokuibacteriota bacterium]